MTSKFNVELIDGLNMILHLLPGVAFSYNGDELGMENTPVPWEMTEDPQALNIGPDLYESRSRDPCRTPFQWNSEPYAGLNMCLIMIFMIKISSATRCQTCSAYGIVPETKKLVPLQHSILLL